MKLKIPINTKGISRDSSVGVATGYGLDGREVRVRVSVKARFFSSPRHLDQFLGPPNGYRTGGCFLRGKAAGA
jgi:hypothetical protein